MNVFDTLLSVIAPHDCLGCRAEGSLLCSECRSTLPPALRRCYRCHTPGSSFRTCSACYELAPITTLLAASRYAGLSKEIVWKMKFARSRSAAIDIAQIMVDRLGLANRLIHIPDLIIVHLPTATSRVRQRGYDQSALISRSLGASCGVPYRPLLRRSGHQEQIGASKVQREHQLSDAFWVPRPAAVKGKRIILIDDIVTTGATLDAAARTLLDAGAIRVDAIVSAQA